MITVENRGNKVTAMVTKLVTGGNSFKLVFGLIDIVKKKGCQLPDKKEKGLFQICNNAKYNKI
jgi:hypothetical protein